MKKPHILPLLCQKSATTCQNDSNKVSSSKSKPDLSRCVKAEGINAKFLPQWCSQVPALYEGGGQIASEREYTCHARQIDWHTSPTREGLIHQWPS